MIIENKHPNFPVLTMFKRPLSILYCLNRFVIVKVLVGAFNKEKALVGTFPCRSESSRRLVGSSNNHYIGPRDPGVAAAEP